MAQHGATWCSTSVVQKSRAGLFSSLVAHQVLVFNCSAVSNRVDMLTGVPINTAASSIFLSSGFFTVKIVRVVASRSCGPGMHPQPGIAELKAGLQEDPNLVFGS